jgi:hypothetical protein
MGQAVTHLEVRRMNLNAQDTCPVSDYRTIPLTQGKVAIVDAADYDALAKYTWYAWRSRKRFYAVRKERRSTILMHRQVLPITEGYQVDHIDGDGLNNRRNNLRAVTPAQNCWNSALQHNNKIGIPGITRAHRGNKWRVRIQVNRKRLELGEFVSLDEAISVRRTAEAKYYGKYTAGNRA